MSDASVAVDTTTPNATRATSLTDVAVWGTSTRFAGWRDNFGGTGTARHAGSRPYYEGDGTSDSPGLSVTQAMARYGEIGGGILINAFSYNSATGNPWPDPTADCPASDTVTYPYYAHSDTFVTGGIAYKDGDGYFAAPSGASGVDSGNPWATLDLKIMQARAMYPKSKIVLCMRAAPAWMTAAWDGSTTNGGTPNIDTPTEPQKVNGNPPLFMQVVASGTAATSIGFCGWFQSGVSAGASGGTIKAAGTGQWGSGTALIGLSNGDTLLLAPGTANEETVTLATLNTSTGAFTITGTFAHTHGTNVLAVKLGGTRILPLFFGGNTCSSGLTASGYGPGTGNVWTFFDCHARLARRVAERYPFIQNFLPWGEPGNTNSAAVTSTNDTGTWLQTNNVWWNDSTTPGSSAACGDQASPAYTPGGRNNIPIATVLYNKLYAALKQVPGRNYTSNPLNFGGPYHSLSAPTNTTTLSASDDGVFTVFFTNAVGLDMVVMDGLSPANTGSTAPAASPVTGLAVAANATTGTLAGFAALATKMAAFSITAPIWQAETYFDSNLAKLNYSAPSVGPAVSNWFTSDAQAMCLASLLYYSVLGGATLTARWQASGDSSSSYNGYADAAFGSTYNIESLVSTSKNSDAATSGLTSTTLGKPFPAHAVYKSIHDNFGPGTALKTATVTDGSATSGKTILALTSATATMLINQYPTLKTIDVTINGGAVNTVSVPGYGILTLLTAPAGVTRTQTLTSPGFNDASNTPYKGIAISCYLSTPGGTPVKNLEGHLLFNGQQFGVGTISDITTGAISLTAVYTGDLTQPDGSATTCQLVVSGANQTIESPVAGYTYAPSIDISTWLPSTSTAGTTRMFLEADNTGSAALQNLGIAIDITATSIKPDGRTIVAGQPIYPFTDANGDIGINMTPTSLLTPNTARYVITLPGVIWYFHVPVNPTGYQGAYAGGTTYHVNAGTFVSPADVVLSGGVLYQCIADTTGHTPPNATYWKVFPGEPIVWNLDAVVVTGAVAITTSNIGHDSNVPPWVDSPVSSPTTLHDDLANMVTAAGLTTVSKSGTYTALETDDWIFVSGASSAWALTLMSVATRRRPLWVFLTNAAHAVTITRAGSDTINGATTLVLSTVHQWVCLKPPASGTDWAALVAGSGGGTVSWAWITKTTTYAILTTDTNILGDATGGAFTVTLPTAVASTQRVSVKKKDSSANAINVGTTSSQLIDGAAAPLVISTQYQSFTFVSDGTGWYVE